MTTEISTIPNDITVVYCLWSQQNKHNQPHCRTYVGYTTNLSKRLRKHRGELKGGAKATQCARDWRVLWFVEGFKCRRHAQQLEWRLHHMRRWRFLKTPPHLRGVYQRYYQLYHALHSMSRVTQSAPLTKSTSWQLSIVDTQTWDLCHQNQFSKLTWSCLRVKKKN